MTKEKQHEFTFWQQVFCKPSCNHFELTFNPLSDCGLAGGTANLTADIFYFPLDTIKTRIQVTLPSNIHLNNQV